eukprot:scaffold17337_cov98-Isochrysis_galbana.AAC.6
MGSGMRREGELGRSTRPPAGTPASTCTHTLATVHLFSTHPDNPAPTTPASTRTPSTYPYKHLGRRRTASHPPTWCPIDPKPPPRYSGDMTGIGLKNTDARMPKLILGSLLPRLPVRVATIVVFNVPWILGKVRAGP